MNSVNIQMQLKKKELEKLQKAITNGAYAKVGILQGKAQEKHQNSKYTNVEIGLKQEFGSIAANIPARSFLRMPIDKKRNEIVEFLEKHKDEIMEALKTGQMDSLLERLGIKGEEIIQEAFATRGFGSWKPNSPVTIAKKGSDSPLIDTKQLRESITSKVEKE